MCTRVITRDLNSRYDEVEVQVEVQVCTKYSAYFEMSKGNNEMFRVQILGSHLRSREMYRVCMDIIHSLHERYIFMRSYVRMIRARRHMRSNGLFRRYKGILRFKFTSCTFVRSIDGIEVLRGEDEKFLSVPL